MTEKETDHQHTMRLFWVMAATLAKLRDKSPELKAEIDREVMDGMFSLKDKEKV